MPRPREISVVLCAYNGAPGVERCLRALREQTIAEALELIVVDDGSSDDTAEVAGRGGARVVRHPANRGLAAARNSGIRAASADIIAFVDDDCIPEPNWAERLLGAYDDDHVAGVGGLIVALSGEGIIGSYLERHNPLGPMEIELGRSNRLCYRLLQYAKRQWSTERRDERRPVYALVGANMSFRRRGLIQAGMFDPRFTFGAEELDLARRVHLRCPEAQLLLEPSARVRHEFEPSLSDVLRRSRAYGRGSARMFVKWRSQRPTVFPLPVIVLALALCGCRYKTCFLAAAVAPIASFPKGPRQALSRRTPAFLLDPYIQILQEAAENVGFFVGWREYRHLQWVDENHGHAALPDRDELSAAA